MHYLLMKFYAQKKEKILLLLVLIIGILLSVQLFSNEYYDLLDSGGRFGLEFFYSAMAAGRLIWVFMLCILIVPNLFAVDYLIDKSSKFSNVLKVRFGSKTYIKKSFLSNFIVSMVCMIFIQLMILLYIHLFLASIKFNYNITPGLSTDASTFVSNEFLNMIIFIISTSFGYAIFSSFIFSLQVFIKNIYIFRVVGVIFGLLLYTGPILLASVLSSIPIVQKLISYFFIGYLINPGVMTTTQMYPASPFITYSISCIIYVSITIFFMKLLIKKECTYD